MAIYKPHPYLADDFWFRNPFWEQPAQTFVDRNGHVDQFLASSPRAVKQFRKLRREMKGSTKVVGL